MAMRFRNLVKSIRIRLKAMPAGLQQEFLTAIFQAGYDFLDAQHLSSGWDLEEKNSNNPLTNPSLKSRTAEVNNIRTLDQLIQELRNRTSQPGGAAALARALGVPHARVSEWLSGKKNPAARTSSNCSHGSMGGLRKNTNRNPDVL